MDFKFDFGKEEVQKEILDSPVVSLSIPSSVIQPSVSRSVTEYAKLASNVSIGNQVFRTVPADLRLEEIGHIASSTDVLPGKYEGGFKLWECTIDLIEYLQKSKLDLNGLNILDLGCGHGLCGISVLLSSPNSIITFHDLNKEVLREQTMVNIVLSCPANAVGSCKFVCGDWGLSKNNLNEKYDIILTCETVYSPSNYENLCEIFYHCFQNNPGLEILLSGKQYYFGLGGGTESFAQFLKVNIKYNAIQTKSVLRINDGVSNIREIISLTLKPETCTMGLPVRFG